MPIKEALAQPPMIRERNIIPHGNFHDSVGSYRKLIEVAHGLLEESGVRGVLDELAEAIRPEFQDVAIAETKLTDGLSLTIGWNHRSEPGFPSMPPLPMVNQVRVETGLGDNLVVWGGKEKEVLTREQWKSPRILKDAVVRAYKDPELFADISVTKREGRNVFGDKARPDGD